MWLKYDLPRLRFHDGKAKTSLHSKFTDLLIDKRYQVIATADLNVSELPSINMRIIDNITGMTAISRSNSSLGNVSMKENKTRNKLFFDCKINNY